MAPNESQSSILYGVQLPQGGSRCRAIHAAVVHDSGPDGDMVVLQELFSADPQLTPASLFIMSRHLLQHIRWCCMWVAQVRRGPSSCNPRKVWARRQGTAS